MFQQAGNRVHNSPCRNCDCAVAHVRAVDAVRKNAVGCGVPARLRCINPACSDRAASARYEVVSDRGWAGQMRQEMLVSSDVTVDAVRLKQRLQACDHIRLVAVVAAAVHGMVPKHDGGSAAGRAPRELCVDPGQLCIGRALGEVSCLASRLWPRAVGADERHRVDKQQEGAVATTGRAQASAGRQMAMSAAE